MNNHFIEGMRKLAACAQSVHAVKILPVEAAAICTALFAAVNGMQYDAAKTTDAGPTEEPAVADSVRGDAAATPRLD